MKRKTVTLPFRELYFKCLTKVCKREIQNKRRGKREENRDQVYIN